MVTHTHTHIYIDARKQINGVTHRKERKIKKKKKKKKGL